MNPATPARRFKRRHHEGVRSNETHHTDEERPDEEAAEKVRTQEGVLTVKPGINVAEVIKAVAVLVSGITEARVTLNSDGQSGYFICTKEARMWCIYFERDMGVLFPRKTDLDIARDIAAGLKP